MPDAVRSGLAALVTGGGEWLAPGKLLAVALCYAPVRHMAPLPMSGVLRPPRLALPSRPAPSHSMDLGPLHAQRFHAGMGSTHWSPPAFVTSDRESPGGLAEECDGGRERLRAAED